MPIVTRSEKLTVEGLQITMTIVPDDNGRSDSAQSVDLSVRWICSKCGGKTALPKCAPSCVTGQTIKAVDDLVPIIGEHMTRQVRQAFRQALGEYTPSPVPHWDL